MIWTRFAAGFESECARHVRESMEGQDVVILKAALMECRLPRDPYNQPCAPSGRPSKRRSADQLGYRVRIARLTEELG